jgi:GNAT superfamily N-acetyltransferase
MIRTATLEDLDACLVMCKRFYDESGVVEVGYSEDKMRETLRSLMDNPDACLLVAEKGALKGMAAAIAYPAYFNGAKVAQELFWWVDPACRGGVAGIKLLRALEDWSKSVGAAALTMVCLPIDSPAESVYQRSGYRPSERSYMKRL